MKKNLMLLVLGLGFVSNAQAGTWTWVNKTNMKLWIKTEFLGCSLTKTCNDQFELAAGATSKPMSKAVSLTTQASPRFFPLNAGQPASNAIKNVLPGVADVTFTITLEKDSAGQDKLVMTKESKGGLLSKAKSSFNLAKEKMVTAFKSVQLKIKALLNRITEQIKLLREKIRNWMSKRKDLQEKLVKQKKAGDLSGAAKTEKEIAEVTQQIEAARKQVVAISSQAEKEADKAYAAVQADTNALEKTASDAVEKSEAQVATAKVKKEKDARVAEIKALSKAIMTELNADNAMFKKRQEAAAK